MPCQKREGSGRAEVSAFFLCCIVCGCERKGKKKNEVNVLEAREVLEKVKNNEISIEEAEKYFKKEPFEEMGYAKLDTHREIRSGFAEVIFCARKADEHLLKIFTRLYEQDGEVFEREPVSISMS